MWKCMKGKKKMRETFVNRKGQKNLLTGNHLIDSSQTLSQKRKKKNSFLNESQEINGPIKDKLI